MTDPAAAIPDVRLRPADSGRASATDLLGPYAPRDGLYDEMLTPRGEVRPHWQPFHEALTSMGQAEFTRRWLQAQNQMHQNGIAYSAYGSPSERARPWELDPLPLLVPSEEWRAVSAALDQRVRLFNYILRDLYGPQDLLERGLLPPEVLYRHPGFRRPLHGLHTSSEPLLQLYAADIARSPDGQWWILSDRTEAPSGAGFALENRILMSRMLPDIFQGCCVERLAPYFVELREAVRRSAPHPKDTLRVAVLSQGPASANYFEDAYLARYLSYTLVEGDDLTVRDNQVMIKTLEGLSPVDVLLRRPNSEDCDQLELSLSGRLGTPGMLHCIRRGGVSTVNPLGSGLVESPVFMAFLPRLCKAVFGEDLAMPGVATWWCGEPSSLTYVLEHLDDLTIRPAYRQRGRELQRSNMLTNMSREQLTESIKAQPYAYVAQEQVSRSTMPVWPQRSLVSNGNTHDPAQVNGQGVSSHIAVRAFVVARDEGYYTMNGGLARVSQSDDPLFVSLQIGERSKDVWVLADEPVAQVTLLDSPSRPLALRRIGTGLPSRVADHVFWLGRHLERADAAARLLRTVGLRITNETYSSDLAEAPVFLRVLVEQGQLEPGYIVAGMRDQMPAIEQGLPESVFDELQPTSLRSIINQLVKAVSGVRDWVSLDCWRIVKRLDEQFRPPSGAKPILSDLIELTDSVVIDLAAFSGLAMESMTRTYTWRFLDLGRRLERALQTIALLKHSLPGQRELRPSLLEAILEIADSLMTYRSRYLANLQLAPLLDLLVTDETNPRSIAYQLAGVVEHVNALPRDRSQAAYTKEQRLAMSALHSVRVLEVSATAELHASGQTEQLARILDRLEQPLPKISDALSHRYLTHAGPTRQTTKPTM